MSVSDIANMLGADDESLRLILEKNGLKRLNNSIQSKIFCW